MILTIILTYLCILNGTLNGVSNIEDNLEFLNYDEFLNNRTFDKLLSEEKTELEEQSFIEEICDYYCEKFQKEMLFFSTFHYLRFCEKMQHKGIKVIISIHMFINFKLIPILTEFNVDARIKYQKKFISTF